MLSLTTRAALITLLLSSAVSHAQERSVSRVSAGLSTSANAFASAWLVQRNVRRAMRYVSTNPVLSSKCDLPPGQTRLPRSPLQKRRMIQQLLTSTLKAFPPYSDVKGAIKPTEIPNADWFESITTDTLQLLQIKPGEDGYLICKLEESPSYRKPLLEARVYYVGFHVARPSKPDLADWVTAWRKESGRWRVFAIGLLAD